MRCELEPNVPVEALAPDPHANKNDLVVIATDGLATGTRDASRMSVLSTPGFIVWLKVGVLAALAPPLAPRLTATNRPKTNRTPDKALVELLPFFLFVNVCPRSIKLIQSAP
jgi:hypothetical protein